MLSARLYMAGGMLVLGLFREYSNQVDVNSDNPRQHLGNAAAHLACIPTAHKQINHPLLKKRQRIRSSQAQGSSKAI